MSSAVAGNSVRNVNKSGTLLLMREDAAAEISKCNDKRLRRIGMMQLANGFTRFRNFPRSIFLSH